MKNLQIKYPKIILVGWLLLIAFCSAYLPDLLSPFEGTGFVALGSKSNEAKTYLAKNFSAQINQVQVLFQANKTTIDSLATQTKIKHSLQKLLDAPEKYLVLLPSSQTISKKENIAVATIALKGNVEMTTEAFNNIKSIMQHQKNLAYWFGGEVAFLNDVNHFSQVDIIKADLIAGPFALILMLWVFRSFTAAALPIVTGAGTSVITLIILYAIAHVYDLSIFTLNIALLLGLCLTLDYALFIIRRFREEYIEPVSAFDAIVKTIKKAGRSVFVSGLTVIVSLSGLLFFSINILRSLAIGGMVAVAMALCTALIILPACLLLLKDQVARPNRLFKKNPNHLLWQWLAEFVVKNKVIFAILTTSFLILIGLPFKQVILGISDQKMLPKAAESHIFVDKYQAAFPNQSMFPLKFIVTTNKPVFSNSVLKKLALLEKTLKKQKDVISVNSLVSPLLRLPEQQWLTLLTSTHASQQLKTLKTFNTDSHNTVVTVIIENDNKQSLAKIESVFHQLKLPFKVSSAYLNNQDVYQIIVNHLWQAMLWVVMAIFILLMVMFRSIVISIKAILMNFLSLSASFGILVLVFQMGYGAAFLSFTPQGMIDITLMVIIFCALFGFSMDYEVFLLSRIYESYLNSRDPVGSVVEGITKTTGVITSAALIVMVICGAFMVAQVLLVKAFGLGIAVAIGVDAFIIRICLVPSTMVMLKDWNWYLPRWLDKCLPRFKH